LSTTLGYYRAIDSVESVDAPSMIKYSTSAVLLYATDSIQAFMADSASNQTVITDKIGFIFLKNSKMV
jgi:hypothetical protein